MKCDMSLKRIRYYFHFSIENGFCPYSNVTLMPLCIFLSKHTNVGNETRKYFFLYLLVLDGLSDSCHNVGKF